MCKPNVSQCGEERRAVASMGPVGEASSNSKSKGSAEQMSRPPLLPLLALLSSQHGNTITSDCACTHTAWLRLRLKLRLVLNTSPPIIRSCNGVKETLIERVKLSFLQDAEGDPLRNVIGN